MLQDESCTCGSLLSLVPEYLLSIFSVVPCFGLPVGGYLDNLGIRTILNKSSDPLCRVYLEPLLLNVL